MQAVNTYIIVDKIKEPKKVVKGLLLTESLDEDNRYNRGKVISVGNLVEGINRLTSKHKPEIVNLIRY